MSIDIAFQLSDSDLEHFRSLMNKAVEKAKDLPEKTVIERALSACDEMAKASLPDFVSTRLESLRKLIDMLLDKEWELPEDERANVLTSLAYFCEPEDLVPDEIPVLGYLDDAIMIELVIQDLSLDLRAYEQFCSFRDTEQTRRGEEAGVSRESWLEGKAKEIRSNMRKKRQSAGRRRVFSRGF